MLFYHINIIICNNPLLGIFIFTSQARMSIHEALVETGAMAQICEHLPWNKIFLWRGTERSMYANPDLLQLTNNIQEAVATIQNKYRRSVKQLLYRITNFVLTVNTSSIFEETSNWFVRYRLSDFDYTSFRRWKESISPAYWDTDTEICNSRMNSLPDMVYLENCEFSQDVGYAVRIGVLKQGDTMRISRFLHQQ